MSYPRRKDLFEKWAKAMVNGATVDKPNYSPLTQNGHRPSAQRRTRPYRRLRLRRARRKNAD